MMGRQVTRMIPASSNSHHGHNANNHCALDDRSHTAVHGYPLAYRRPFTLCRYLGLPARWCKRIVLSSIPSEVPGPLNPSPT